MLTLFKNIALNLTKSLVIDYEKNQIKTKKFPQLLHHHRSRQHAISNAYENFINYTEFKEVNMSFVESL